MTAEAALTKLYYLFGRGYSPERVKKEMVKDLRGEVTPLEILAPRSGEGWREAPGEGSADDELLMVTAEVSEQTTRLEASATASSRSR